MRVVLINHSDSLGGASVVTYRLLKALQAEGVEASMLVTHKSGNDPTVVEAAPQWRAKIPFYAEAARIFTHNGFDRADLFKVSLGSDGLPLSRHPLVRNADAVILAWVNQGMLSLKETGDIAAEKPVIWTMHDMWNLTGICHHAGTCTGFTRQQGCSHCPMLHARAGRSDLSARTWRRKRELYSRAGITFVAVSNWLAEKCRCSPLMDGCRIEVIPNAFPIDEFHTTPRTVRKEAGLPEGRIVLMGAARLDDPVKGLPLAVEALNRLDPASATAVFFGNIRDASVLEKLRMPFVMAGEISDRSRLAELYAHADVVLSSSLYETLPGTLVEGQAAGAFPVAFDSGGQSDIISHRTTGYLARPYDTADLAAGIAMGLEQPATAETLRSSAERFRASEIASRYLRIIDEA